jgi:hypothetical protein
MPPAPTAALSSSTPYKIADHPLLVALAAKDLWERRQFLSKKNGQGYPRFLYKYRALDPANVDSVSRLRAVLVESKLWLSSPADFNDPFDMSAQVIVSGTAEQKERKFAKLLDTFLPAAVSPTERKALLVKLTAMSNEELVKTASPIHEAGVKALGVYSLAGEPRSILMWSHYTRNHEGLCIQFEVARDTSTFLQALRVEYEPDFPVINWMAETVEDIKKTILRKEPGWKYEGEHRIIIPKGARTILFFQPAALVGLIFGCRIHSMVKAKVLELLDERTKGGLPPVKTYVAKKHPSLYQLRLSAA